MQLSAFWKSALEKVLVGLVVAAVLAIPFGVVFSKIVEALAPSQEVPIGGVVAFWGSVDQGFPKGYELCDGELVTTSRSPINGQRKPNLTDAFIKGAAVGVRNVQESPETGGANSVSLSHAHPAGSLFALITQKKVSGNNFNIPHVARGQFDPTNGGWGLGGSTPSASFSGRWSGKEDAMPPGTAVEGSTAEVPLNFDNRPKFTSLLYLIRVR